MRTVRTGKEVALRITSRGWVVFCSHFSTWLKRHWVSADGSAQTGDLGAIDAKYDVAVSTAAPALDYMVVADTPTAQACVDLLRQKRLGVATFLILDKQAHLARKAAEAGSTPEGAASPIHPLICDTACPAHAP